MVAAVALVAPMVAVNPPVAQAGDECRPGELCLYEGLSYDGPAIAKDCVEPGFYNIGRERAWSDRTHSFRNYLPPGTQVWFYDWNGDQEKWVEVSRSVAPDEAHHIVKGGAAISDGIFINDCGH
ncbi:peptidase inhibitor family I36 protein [Amycolatopsis nigrescens]|uniref:peptidase inhibitor family I36 protein n=1 Tax=Amycolatopsis nigrescens TaxID=381445 RepID=UPI000369B203|nr:peptidase inhibitor family I36 protein [Amycolatopsis nigrescens]